MRITAGKYKGRTIRCPKGVIRPAMDRMRESMFSIMGNLEGLSFLDLFSGSGLVGIEAASRGAEPVHLVEMDRIKKRVIGENTAMVDTEIRPFIMSVQKYLKMARFSFDVIYLDPPFPMQDKPKLLDLVTKSRALGPDTRVLIHYPSEDEMPEKIGCLERYDLRTYGRSLVAFYRNVGE